MKRGINKKGQFYLLAAIIIISLIIGFSAVSNYTKKTSPAKLYDLGEELGIESVEVIEYGVYNQLGEGLSNLTIHFTGIYTSFVGEGKEMYFIVGDENDVFLYTYKDITGGTVTIDIGQGQSKLEIINKELKKENITPAPGEDIIVVIKGIKYNFKLKPGEIFYFVIVQQIDGETYVVTG